MSRVACGMLGVVRDYVVASHVAPVAPPISSCLARFSLAMATTPKRDGNLSFESPNVEIMNILQNICGEIHSDPVFFNQAQVSGE